MGWGVGCGVGVGWGVGCGVWGVGGSVPSMASMSSLTTPRRRRDVARDGARTGDSDGDRDGERNGVRGDTCDGTAERWLGRVGPVEL